MYFGCLSNSWELSWEESIQVNWSGTAYLYFCCYWRYEEVYGDETREWVALLRRVAELVKKGGGLHCSFREPKVCFEEEWGDAPKINF